MISIAGIFIADEANLHVKAGMPVYDGIRLAVEQRERQIIVALEKAREAYRPTSVNDMISIAKIDAINVALSLVKDAK